MMLSLFNHMGVIKVSAEGTGNDSDNGLVLNKSVSGPDKNGVYTLTLEAYATGEKVTQIVNKDVPTDIVLVLDQSGSMDYNFTDGITGVSRLQALKTAVSGFTNAVYNKAKGKDGQPGTSDDVNHRIAMVGFAAGWKNNNNSLRYYKNTELFIGSSQYTYNAGSYNNPADVNSAQSHYKDAFQNMNTVNGYNNVIASNNNLDADGGTITNLGIDMANGIFNQNPISSGEKRNRVVVVFTDGVPGWSGYDSEVAGAAIAQSSICKNTNNAKVYTVGIFSGANPSSEGNASGNETQRANWFMQNLSSNNGKVQTPSFYLAANSADGLNNVFQQISEEISTGGSSVTLDENAVVKDTVSEYFSLPAGVSTGDIKVYTADYTAESTFAGENPLVNSRITISGKTIAVSNFSFKDNWVGKETNNGTVSYRGKKLIIKIPVVVREGFLGGNDVPTNGDGSGVYENAGAAEPFKEFISPHVDVAINDITITAPNKNVYLYGGLTHDQLTQGVEMKCGNVAINTIPGAINYGLQAWQNAYVNISVYTDPASFSNLTSDEKYSVSCTVEPKTDGSAEEKTGSKEASISVFKPVLTFKDSEAYYGDKAGYGDYNKVSQLWKHGETVSTAVSMIGDAPVLTLTYQPRSGIENGFIAATEDILVDVGVKLNNSDINQYTTFINGTSSHNGQEDYEEFTVNVKTCTLKLSKSGCENVDEGQSFIFNVKGSGSIITDRINMNVVVRGNGSITITGLPIGKYAIKEDTQWSWRYRQSGTSEIELTPSNPDNSSNPLNVNNNRPENKWLDGNGYFINVFGKPTSMTVH